MTERTYVCVDLKSFYASVECMELGLDPMTTHLVVADVSRTEKTICLAVSPSLRVYGIPGRARLFEVVQRVREINAKRRIDAPGGRLVGKSCDAVELEQHPEFALDYIAATPRMARYMEISTQIYQIYLKYVAPEDIHVYSIDEVFLDLTDYLAAAGGSARELTKRMILDVFETTGITAAAGMGSNLYLAKVAMDIEAKHTESDGDGVRIAYLDEKSYRQRLWCHRPLTDFWRVGQGYARRLQENGLFTMGDIARCSLGGSGEYHNEELLYRLFGVNAELLIDHAWGWEPCTMDQIKAYKPESSSIGSGQVLHCAYDFDSARLVVSEMVDQLSLDLVDRGLVTDQIVLSVGYDIENLTDPERQRGYSGPVTVDPYGRRVPGHAQGTARLEAKTSSGRQIAEAVLKLYDRIVDPSLLIRRINVAAGQVEQESAVKEKQRYEQLDLFTDYEALEKQRQEQMAEREKERCMQQAVLDIKKKYGKNAILKGMSLQENATARERNKQIGGHKA